MNAMVQMYVFMHITLLIHGMQYGANVCSCAYNLTNT